MAVVTPKGTIITNAEAGVLTNGAVYRGVLRDQAENIEVANGDSIASIYRLLRVPSNAVMSRLLLSCDAITSAAADIGVYRTTADGGAVVDVDFFASAQSIAAALVNTDITHEADPTDAGVGFGLADTRKMLWEALGFTSDPRCELDIAATLTAAATAAGTLGLRAQFKV